MATTPLGTVLHRLRRAWLGRDEAGPPDDELLEGFVTRHDEDAFAVLVRRHGPMVLAVCRRVLRNEADAEDAFQATFLVLVRKAATIRPRGMVGNWLYGVAHTTALKARAMSTKRRAKEREAAARSKAAVPAETWRELYALLDQELETLPDKYRAAIVLCDLEGQSIKEAARLLGCPLGTLGARLSRGRNLLARRLARHGLPLSGGVIGAAIAQNAATAGVPLDLLNATFQAGTLVLAGQAATSEVISAKVAALTEGVLKTMLLTKLKMIPGLLAGAAVLGGALGVLGPPTWTASQAEVRAQEPWKPPKVPAQEPEKPAAKEPEADGKKLSEWVQLLLSEDVIERQAAVLALGKIGPDAAPALTFALNDREVVNCRLWAAHALGKMGAKAKDAIPQLEATLKDECGLVRIEAAKALWKIDMHKAVVPALRDSLKDADPTTRYSAAEALGGIGPAAKEAVPALVEALKDAGFAEFHQPNTSEFRAVSAMAAKVLKQVDPETAKKHGIE